ncbi:sensor histidine kinase [Deinococcus wulumuqiensis]|uniref:histidine kinase n=1 Tax=Deinococcus wulumuqiensis TaxID=980427 RepID=A0A345II79_9DEIO|nr:HAMP domain-containing sensor histidine kinase [Deinococcus wulumuqiensis]AXG99401.1 sensor histidine kinase [Deinococcus wulumuqiensis]
MPHSPSSLASRLTPGAGLHSARVAWRHSLRFRLALMYTLSALVMTAVIGLGITSYLLGQMNRQFDARLGERADAVAERFVSKTSDIGQGLPPISGYTAILDEDGRVLGVSSSLKTDTRQPFRFGDAFPYPRQGQFDVLDVPMRATTRAAPDYGTVWVALPETDLVVARTSATRALLLSLLVAPLLLLLLGWLVGQRMLAGLGEAADLADRIDPSRSLATLPLPAREDEVHRLLAAINRLLVRIEAGQLREKQLLGQIVHELGAPLTVLKATLGRAGERTGDPEVQRAALVADELTFTTQDLMQLARGQLEMKLVWHYISARTLQDRLDRLVPGVAFGGDWSGGILCDPDRLTQALRNLLANARRHAGLDGQVSCTLIETPEWLTFTVRDSGPGLPPELGERIFDPFVSGAGSSGLGLSVSRQIAAMHGGTLTGGNHLNAEGRVAGAEFVLTVPGAALGEDEEDEVLEEDTGA